LKLQRRRFKITQKIVAKIKKSIRAKKHCLTNLATTNTSTVHTKDKLRLGNGVARRFAGQRGALAQEKGRIWTFREAEMAFYTINFVLNL
jgi:hypothetical protein